MRAESPVTPPLVGRDGLLSRLRLLLQAPYRSPHAILLEGPAGIGKTSLLNAGVALARTSGATVMHARPVETEATFAYATLTELLRPHLAVIRSVLPAFQGEALRGALGIGDTPDANPATLPESEAQPVATAVLAAFRALATRTPLVVAVDDASWADSASRDALAYAFRRIADVPMRVLIVERRDDAGGSVPFDLANSTRPIPLERLWVAPLSTGAIHEMLRVVTGGTFPRSALLRIRELSGGNPFYALELARALASSGATIRPGQDLPMPSSLRELLGARLGNLPDETRRLLLTSALSANASLGLLEAYHGGDVERALRPALEADVVRLDHQGLAFSHPLFASVVVAAASAFDIRSTHAWLGRAAAEDPEARARHLALASDGPDQVVARALIRAAARARQRGAAGVAGALMDLAVERTPPRSADLPVRALSAAEAWFAAGDIAAARRRAETLLPTVHGTLRARTLLLIGLSIWYTGTTQQAIAALQAALAEARQDRAFRGLLEFYLAVFSDDDVVAARGHALMAARLLGKTADRGHFAAALLQAFHWSVALGRQPPMQLLTRGLTAETEGPLTDRLTSPGIWWAGIGRLDRARDRFQLLLDFDLAHGEYANADNLLTRLAEVELWADDWVLARQHAVAAVEAGIETRGTAPEMALRALALVDAHQGHLERAETAASAGVARTERAGSPVLAAAWYQVLAFTAASRGDAARGEDATRRAQRHLEAVGYREPLRLDPAPERIEALALLGRADDAVIELAGLEARHRRIPKPWAEAAISRGRSRVALARGDPATALAATSQVASGSPPDWSRFEAARTMLVRAEALRRWRSRRGAADALERAEGLFRALGAETWAGRAAAEHARLGLVRSAGLVLTPTEERVARLAGNGLSTRDVAVELRISPRTVETHLASVYAKLGVNSRAELGRVIALRANGVPETSS